MTIRERIYSILKGKIPDRLPWCADLAYWYFSRVKKGNLKDNYKGIDGIFNLHKDLNVGFYMSHFEPYIPVYKNCKVTEVERDIDGYKDYTPFYRGSTVIKGNKKNEDIIREVSTPIGTIKEIWPYATKSFTWAPKKHFINTAKELEVFKYWIKNTNYKPDYEHAHEVKELLGGQGAILCYQPRSPLMQLIVLYAGIFNTINLMMDHKKLFSETIKILEYKSDEAAEITINSPAEFIMVPDNISSDIVGENLYELYLRPYHEKWNKKIKAYNKYSFVHMDGYLKGLLTQVSRINFSVIEALTPKPVGDLEITEFSELVRSDSIMWGGIPGVIFTSMFDDEKFEKYVKKVIKIMVSKPKYVLGIGDQIPPDGIIERIKIVSDLVERYGIYRN